MLYARHGILVTLSLNMKQHTSNAFFEIPTWKEISTVNRADRMVASHLWQIPFLHFTIHVYMHIQKKKKKKSVCAKKMLSDSHLFNLKWFHEIQNEPIIFMIFRLSKLHSLISESSQSNCFPKCLISKYFRRAIFQYS